VLTVSRHFSLLTIRPPPGSPLFPYTTLFRSPLGRRRRRRRSRAACLSRSRRRRGGSGRRRGRGSGGVGGRGRLPRPRGAASLRRSEEHTSELQSLTNLLCRPLLEKKKNQPAR